METYSSVSEKRNRQRKFIVRVDRNFAPQATAESAAIAADPNKTTAKVTSFVATANANNAALPETHAITPALKQLLINLYSATGNAFTWYNFVHPGDFVAYPIEKLMPAMLGNPAQHVNIQDFLVTDAGPQWFEGITPVTMLNAGGAHQSYGKSNLVAEHIAQAIKMS